MSYYLPQGTTPASFAPRGTNGLAIAAFVSSFFISPVGVILGHMSLKQIKTSGEGGRGLAITALIIGYLALGIAAILLISLFAAGGTGTSQE